MFNFSMEIYRAVLLAILLLLWTPPDAQSESVSVNELIRGPRTEWTVVSTRDRTAVAANNADLRFSDAKKDFLTNEDAPVTDPTTEDTTTTETTTEETSSTDSTTKDSSPSTPTTTEDTSPSTPPTTEETSSTDPTTEDTSSSTPPTTEETSSTDPTTEETSPSTPPTTEDPVERTAGYGDQCNYTLPEGPQVCCMKYRGLICSETDMGHPGVYTCVCQDNTMTYDPKTKRCLANSGENCDDEERLCTANSQCINSKCQCLPEYQETISNECKMSHGAQGCSGEQDCDYFAFLSCSPKGQCVCQQEDLQYWDPSRAVCQSYVGGSCEPPYWNPGHERCTVNAECLDNLCNCNVTSGLKVSPQGFCLQGYQQPCDLEGIQDGSKCHPDFVCVDDGSSSSTTTEATTSTTLALYIDIPGQWNAPTLVGKCGCLETEVYDSNDDWCMPMAGESCERQKLCGPHASCLPSSLLCRCDFGYSETKDGFCKADFKTPCEGEGTCNSEKNLVCTQGSCGCIDGFSYNQERRMCVGELGVACSWDWDCIDHARCDPSSNTCTCESGYSQNPLGECRRDYKYFCDEQNPCNYHKFLECPGSSPTGGFCDCESPSGQRYDSSHDECVGLAGPSGSCMLSPENSRQLKCVSNASCESNPSEPGSNFGLCSCLAGFEVSALGECVPAANDDAGNVGIILKSSFITVNIQVVGVVLLHLYYS